MRALQLLISQMSRGIVSGTLPSGAVAQYKGENNVLDVGGTYNATAGAGTGYTTGKDGQGFNFTNNSNQRVLIPTINIGSAYSITAWIFMTSAASASDYTIIGNIFSSAANFGELYVFGAGSTPFSIRYFSNSANRAQSSAALPLNAWHKITLTYDGSKIRIYINDILYATESATHSETYNNQAGIGYPASGSSTAFNGIIDEVTLYNSAITPPALPGDLAAWYKGNSDTKDSAWGWDCTAGVGTAYTTGNSGNCFLFNGNTNSAVNQPQNFAFPAGASWSVECDVYIDASGNTGFRDVWGNAWNGGTAIGTLYLNGGKYEYWSNGAKVNQGTSTPATTTWHHVKITWSAVDSKSRLYVNGSLENTSTAHTENYSQGIAMGASRSATTAAFFGRIDDMKIYNALV
jgi:hypothetical protein